MDDDVPAKSPELCLVDELAKLAELRKKGVISSDEVDELAKFVKLLDKGVISKQEYEGKKYAILTVEKKKQRQSLLGSVSNMIIGALSFIFSIWIILGYGVYYLESNPLDVRSIALPTCESDETYKVLSEIISSLPYYERRHIKLVTLTNIIEISYNKDSLERICTADGYVSVSKEKEHIRFKISMVDRKKGVIWVELMP